MLFNYGSLHHQINDNKKCRQIAGNFDCHADAAVRCKAHRQMEQIQGFIQSNCMLPLGKCLHRIAPAAVTIDEIAETTQNNNKTQLLASNYGSNRSLVVYENFMPQNGSST